MEKTEEYALFLMLPSTSRICSTLKSTLSKLSRKYNTPYFEPHVTLITGVGCSEKEAIQKTAKIASTIKPYTIELENIGHLNKYYQSLFVKTRKTPEVMDANLVSRKIFGQETNSKYMPHLSVIYGNFSEETKKEIIKKIGKPSGSFMVREIQLFSIAGEVKDWYRIKIFPLR